MSFNRVADTTITFTFMLSSFPFDNEIYIVITWTKHAIIIYFMITTYHFNKFFYEEALELIFSNVESKLLRATNDLSPYIFFIFNTSANIARESFSFLIFVVVVDVFFFSLFFIIMMMISLYVVSTGYLNVKPVS